MKYKFGDVVRHIATGQIYCILGDPSQNYTMEQTGESAYIYGSGLSPVYTKWIRPQAEMEDGRFEKVIDERKP